MSVPAGKRVSGVRQISGVFPKVVHEGIGAGSAYLVGPAQPHARFRCIRSVPCGKLQEDTRTALRTAQVFCMRTRRERPAAECLHCARFLDVTGARGRRTTLRCDWSSDDPLREIVGEATVLVTVPTYMDAREANDFARRRLLRHLLVVEDGQLAGIVCRCDLVESDGELLKIAELMTPEVHSASPETTIGEAVAIMAERGIGALPIVDRGKVLAMVTRGDLRRVGVPEYLLGARRCAACDSVHGVRLDPRSSVVEYCLDCLDTMTDPVDPDELGCGD